MYSIRNRAKQYFNEARDQGWPGFWGIQYIVVFNFRYTVFLCLKLGITYTVFFLILVFYMSFSIIFGILEGLFPGILVFNYPPG